MKKLIALALVMVVTGAVTAYAAITTNHTEPAQPVKSTASIPAEKEASKEQETPSAAPQEAPSMPAPPTPEAAASAEAATVLPAEVTSTVTASTVGAKKPLPFPQPTGITPPIPEPGSIPEPEPIPDPPQPPVTIIGDIYSGAEAAQAGHDHMTVYGWEYASDLSMTAGNCGYYPAVVLPAAQLQNSGGQAALNQAVMDTVDDTYARLYARSGEAARWASVRCDVSYREANDEYVINILYA